MRDQWFVGTLLLSLLTASAVLAQSDPTGSQVGSSVPVVLAVDTSRSLDPSELAVVVDRLRAVLNRLDDQTPAALLAFDDQPRWLLRRGSSLAEVGEALEELTLQGNYTLLYDALFVAVRELPAGGVVLLATDGRDENSATTVEDIARRCEAQNVRIVSLGVGRGVQERSLRRLALLSNGAYLGPASRVETAAVAQAVAAARAAVVEQRLAAVEAEAARRLPVAVSPPAETTAAAPAEPADGSQTGVSGWLGNTALLAGLAALLAAGALLWLKARRGRPSYCQKCGTELQPGQASCEHCEALELRTELANREVATLEEAPEVTVDTAVFHQMDFDEKLDRTRVLANQSVLLVRKPGEGPRSFLLDSESAFAVGRERKGNTLAVPDPSLSAHHFKIVPEADKFYLVDLESTNGCFINGVRVPVKELRSGDIISAGQLEFELNNNRDF